MSEESDEEILTAIDILEQEKIIEEEASALFGDFDNNICTYEKEYMKRQPLYSCLTCKLISGEPAGICLACSLNCHENHTLVELYTKRSFRCDCGNKNFKDNPCLLYNDKDNINVENKYNQNFEGLYCICKRPYPDEENENESEMIQCILCEDWFHTNHLGTQEENIPDSKSFSEFICTQCSGEHKFLHTYYAQIDNLLDNTPKSSNLDEKNNNQTDLACFYKLLLEKHPIIAQSESQSDKLEVENVNEETDQKRDDNLVTLDLKTAHPKMSDNFQTHLGPFFWPNEKWRDILCQCKACLEMYKNQNIEYICDPKDTMVYFTRKRLSTSDQPLTTNNEDGVPSSSTPCESQYEKGLAAFSKLNKVVQNDMLHQFNSMKDNFKEYLKDFVSNGKVVKKDDILEFFEREAKRPKIDSFVPSTCR